ncbi:replication-associated protein [Camellia oleifera geminivirus]|nr:replication-associated protein [Camellia oleifera geminivirus]
MPRTPGQFRVYAKNFFLTYPRCSLSKEEALAAILSFQYPTNIKYVRICRELHSNGEPHLHMLIQLQGKFNCRNPRFFDIQSPSQSIQFHPNIVGAKSSSDVKSYIEKDGDIIEHGEFQIDPRSARGGQSSINEAYAAALNTGNKLAALQVIRELDPKTFVTQFHNLNSNLERIFEPPPQIFISKYNPNSFRVTDNMEQWLGESGILDESPVARPLSIIIEGPSRIGKTQWARSLGPHNYLAGHLDFSPKAYSNEVKYNIIDDVAPTYLKMKHWKELIGAQSDWQTNCKYGRPRIITGGIPAIVLCNPGEGASYNEFLDKPENQGLKNWTLANCYIEVLDGHPLFTTQHNQTPPSQGQTETNPQEEI